MRRAAPCGEKRRRPSGWAEAHPAARGGAGSHAERKSGGAAGGARVRCAPPCGESPAGRAGWTRRIRRSEAARVRALGARAEARREGERRGDALRLAGKSTAGRAGGARRIRRSEAAWVRALDAAPEALRGGAPERCAAPSGEELRRPSLWDEARPAVRGGVGPHAGCSPGGAAGGRAPEARREGAPERCTSPCWEYRRRPRTRDEARPAAGGRAAPHAERTGGGPAEVNAGETRSALRRTAPQAESAGGGASGGGTGPGEAGCAGQRAADRARGGLGRRRPRRPIPASPPRAAPLPQVLRQQRGHPRRHQRRHGQVERPQPRAGPQPASRRLPEIRP